MRLPAAIIAAMMLVGANCALGQTVGCSSQVTVSPGLGGPVSCAYQGPGDFVSGASVFYGLRAYTSAIAAKGTQKLINVVRASDSETCDVLVATSGGLGQTANCSGADSAKSVSTWLNATTGSVATWYDQSGNGVNATQATAINQPTLTQSCLNGLPCLTAAGVAFLAGTMGGSVVQPLSETVIAERTAGFTSQAQILEAGGNGPFFNGTANTVGVYFGAAATATANDSVEHIIEFSINGATSAMYVDGVGSVINPSVSPAGPALSFFGNSIAAATLTGNIIELGLWPVAFSSSQAAAMCHNQLIYLRISGGAC